MMTLSFIINQPYPVKFGYWEAPENDWIAESPLTKAGPKQNTIINKVYRVQVMERYLQHNIHNMQHLPEWKYRE